MSQKISQNTMNSNIIDVHKRSNKLAQTVDM